MVQMGDRFAIDHDEILSFIHGKQAITSIRHFMPGRSEEDIGPNSVISSRWKPLISKASSLYRGR